MAKKTPKKTTKTKTRRPLSISIHGDDLHIEAKFGDARLSELLADTIKRVNNSPPTASSAQPSSVESPIVELVTELAKSLRTDQLEALSNMFDMPQKLLFMEILNITKPASDREHVS